MPDTEPTEPQQNDRYRGLRPFQPGQSGNPAGRPKGSRNKLGEAFVTDLLNDWQTNGINAIADMREKSPTDYCKVVAAVIPKEVHHTVEDYDDLSDDELAEQFAAVAARLASSSANGGRIRAALEGEGGSAQLPN